MNDDQLLERLRSVPTGDRRHVPGRVFDRLAATAVRTPRPWSATRQTQPFGIVAVALAVVATMILLQSNIVGPGATPPVTPTPQPSVMPTAPGLDDTQLAAAVASWAIAHPGADAIVTVIDAQGVGHQAAAGTRPGSTSRVVVRIGEVSRMFVVSAMLGLVECSASRQLDVCPLPIGARSLALDDRLERWFPGTSAGDRTVRQLLDGTSGVAAIAESIPALRERLIAGAEPERSALIATALAAPERFAAGARREPVDTEYVLLEEIIGQVVGRPSADWIDASTISHLGLDDTALPPAPVSRLAPGRLGDGTSITDLEPGVLEALGATGGLASTSEDLARFANAAWGSAVLRAPASIQHVTDAANGHRAPWGAVSGCPCAGDAAETIFVTGHAGGWSAAALYDFGAKMAVGITSTTDVGDVALRDLFDRIAGAARR